MKKFVVLMMLFSFGLFGVTLGTGCSGDVPAKPGSSDEPDGGADPAAGGVDPAAAGEGAE